MTAANPFDTKFNRETMAVEVIDTRNPSGKAVACFSIDVYGFGTQAKAEAHADSLRHDELMNQQPATPDPEPTAPAVPMPAEWTTPKFTFGQTVYVKHTYNDPMVVVGLRYAPYKHIENPIWYYQLSEIKPWRRDLTSLFNGFAYAGPETDEEEISAIPWCDECREAVSAHSVKSTTGNDMETAQACELHFCDECYRMYYADEADKAA